MSKTRRIFRHFGQFLPFYLHNNPENQDIEQMKKKHLKISSFSACVPKIMIIWCMPPEIRSATDRIFVVMFCLFIPITTRKIHFLKKWKNTRRNYSFTHVQQKLRSYYVCFLKYGAWHADFFVILGVFFVLLPPWQPGKWKFFKNKKKTSGNIIISHMCTTNGNHMIYGS